MSLLNGVLPLHHQLKMMQGDAFRLLLLQGGCGAYFNDQFG